MTLLAVPRLSLLGLSCFGLACTELQAQVTPATAPPALGADAVRAVLAELDARFARGDVAGYLAQFAPDHQGAHAMLQRQLEHCTTQCTSRQRTSTLVGEPRVVGPRTVVRVRHQVELQPAHADDPRPVGKGATFAEESLLVLRREADGTAVPTLSVELAPTHADAANDDHFRCPACNYEIGGVPGWLCVPLRNDRAGALEATSFYLLGTELACDVSVQVDPEPRPALLVAQAMIDTLCRIEGGARAGLVEPWLPPSLAGATPEALTGARGTIELAADYPEAGGGRAILHVLTFGGLQHLLLVRGSVTALRTHDAALQALLASYRLLERDCNVALAQSRPLQHHTGGALDGSTYRNEQYGVELVGPPGWTPSLRSGGALFRVVWCSKDGDRLWLVGHQVPPGMRRWCTSTADRWLAHLCERHGLAIAAPGDGSDDWRDLPSGGRARAVVATAAGPVAPATPRQRWIRMQLHDDLLLVADGFAATLAGDAALRAALATLRRR